jgi:hypothetical protein
MIHPNKPDHHDIAEILLKVALNTITLTLTQYDIWTEAKRNTKLHVLRTTDHQYPVIKMIHYIETTLVLDWQRI